MINLAVLASIALALRIVAAFFIVIVIIKQRRLLKMHIQEQLRLFRRILFFLSLVMFIGTGWSVIVDLLTITNVDIGRPAYVGVISATYVLTNAGTACAQAGFIWLLYLLASNAKKITDFTEEVLTKDLRYNDHITKEK